MNKKTICNFAFVLAVTALPTFAVDDIAAAVPVEAAKSSVYDNIWSTTELVNNKDAAVLQNLAIVGRLQGDAVSFQSEDGSYDDFDWRRFRLGFKAKLFNDFLIHVEMDGDMNAADENSWNEFYGRLTDAYAGWDACKEATLKVGKQSAGFTLDGATSSTKLIVPERSIVAENLWFPTEYFTGASVSGKINDWSYKAGGYSASGEEEFGHFESGYFTLLSAGHKIGKKGNLRLDYVYNDPDYSSDSKYFDKDGKKNGVGTKKLEHIVALVYQTMLSEKLGLWTDIAGATGIDSTSQGDLLGIDIMPFYNISKEFQLVAQYAGVTDMEGTSDVSMSRYASKNADKAKAETAHNFLLGFNWYLYGHKLKWQNAVEYNYGQNVAKTGEDYKGYGFTSALRVSW